jgi:hypothetical protein
MRVEAGSQAAAASARLDGIEIPVEHEELAAAYLSGAIDEDTYPSEGPRGHRPGTRHRPVGAVVPDPYVDPSTSVLLNRLGIADARTLALAEARLADHAEVRLYAHRPQIEQFDLAPPPGQPPRCCPDPPRTPARCANAAPTTSVTWAEAPLSTTAMAGRHRRSRTSSVGVIPNTRRIHRAMWLWCANPTVTATWLGGSSPCSSNVLARSTRRSTT